MATFTIMFVMILKAFDCEFSAINAESLCHRISLRANDNRKPFRERVYFGALIAYLALLSLDILFILTFDHKSKKKLIAFALIYGRLSTAQEEKCSTTIYSMLFLRLCIL